ncbi:hypothetical protein L1887_10701 [Cichorium endivia]|nr:hypothetical protein L1887_10701 [Cichorium endivia]
MLSTRSTHVSNCIGYTKGSMSTMRSMPNHCGFLTTSVSVKSTAAAMLSNFLLSLLKLQTIILLCYYRCQKLATQAKRERKVLNKEANKISNYGISYVHPIIHLSLEIIVKFKLKSRIHHQHDHISMPIDCNRELSTEAHFITDGIRRCYEARALKSLQYGYSDALINRISDFLSDNKNWACSMHGAFLAVALLAKTNFHTQTEGLNARVCDEVSMTVPPLEANVDEISLFMIRKWEVIGNNLQEGLPVCSFED